MRLNPLQVVTPIVLFLILSGSSLRRGASDPLCLGILKRHRVLLREAGQRMGKALMMVIVARRRHGEYHLANPMRTGRQLLQKQLCNPRGVPTKRTATERARNHPLMAELIDKRPTTAPPSTSVG